VSVARRAEIARDLAAGTLVAMAGGLVVFLLARAVSMSTTDAWKLTVATSLTTGAAGVVGLVALHLLRHRPLGVQAASVALTGVVAVASGAWAVSHTMFQSHHDFEVLWVVLAAAALVGAGTAVLLGRRVEAASRSLVEMARRIGTADGSEPAAARGDQPPVATVELARLARELDEMSVALDAARTRERALETSRRELVAWVSHDLRSPLAAIRAMAEALEDGVVDDSATVGRYHHQLVVEVDRLAGLVDDLFELSRTQAGVLALEMEKVSLSDLVSDALAGAVPVAQAKGVRLEGRMEGTAPVLELSAAEVARALRNLLENAIRHTPADGTVMVEAGVEGPDAYVSVLDTCGGIPEVDLDRVFDIAFRGEAARTPGQGGGAGLGLAIARGMVEAHGGEISVGNEEGGCRFTVRLPLAREGAG
jgi:signal transduction histidine kinase